MDRNVHHHASYQQFASDSDQRSTMKASNV
jgi:hypothetical protein